MIVELYRSNNNRKCFIACLNLHAIQKCEWGEFFFDFGGARQGLSSLPALDK